MSKDAIVEVSLPVGLCNGEGNGTAYDYGSGDHLPWVIISTVDGRQMRGLEFLYGNGWPGGVPSRNYGNDAATVEWEAYVGATLVSSGSTVLPVGTVVGFSNASGFDSRRVRATSSTGYEMQTIALDNLKVQLAPIPEPSTCIVGGLLLLPFGLQAMTRMRKQA